MRAPIFTIWHSSCIKRKTPKTLRRFADPPQESANDAPGTICAQGHGLIFAIFGLEHLHTTVAAKSGNREAFLLMPDDNECAVEFRTIGLRVIDRHDIAIMDQRTHGVSFHPKASGIGRIGTPLRRRRNHVLRMNLVEIEGFISAFAVSGGMNSQEGKSDTASLSCSYPLILPFGGFSRVSEAR